MCPKEEAAIIPLPDEEIGNQIKPFVVLRNRQRVARSVLAAFYASRLPKYIIPHQFEIRTALPKLQPARWIGRN